MGADPAQEAARSRPPSITSSPTIRSRSRPPRRSRRARGITSAVTYDGSSRAAGLRLFLDGRAAATRITIDHLERSILHAGDGKNWTGPHVLKIGRRHDETLSDVSVDEFRLYDRELTPLEVASVAGVADPLTDALRNADAPASRAALREQFVRRHVPRVDRRPRRADEAAGRGERRS